MTHLAVFAIDAPRRPLRVTDDVIRIIDWLEAIGARYEYCVTDDRVAAGDGPDRLLGAYGVEVARLKSRWHCQKADVVSVSPNSAGAAGLRARFRFEHCHHDDEIRWFLRGSGSFFLRHHDQVYRLACEAGDALGIPADMRHWFDCGDRPDFTAIRLFTDPAGWVAHPTGDDIAERFTDQTAPLLAPAF